MKRLNFRDTVIGFFTGIAIATIGGIVNWQIHKQKADYEQNIHLEQNKEKLTKLISELNTAYDQFKLNIKNDIDCVESYIALQKISSISINLMGQTEISREEKMELLEFISKLEFITNNYCGVLEKYGKPVITLVDGKPIKGFPFADNLKETDTIMAQFLYKVVATE